MNQQDSNMASKTNGMAVTSMVLGILGIVVGALSLGIIPLFAIILGHISYKKIKHSGGVQHGSGMAIAGFVMGYVSLAIALVFGLLAAIAIPSFHEYSVRARMHEVVAAAAPYKSAIGELLQYGTEPGKINTNPELIGIMEHKKIHSRHVQRIAYDAYGVITIYLQQDSKLRNASGKTIVLIPRKENDKVIWKIDYESSTVPKRLLPRDYSKKRK